MTTDVVASGPESRSIISGGVLPGDSDDRRTGYETKGASLQRARGIL